MTLKSNDRRRGGLSISLFEGILIAALLHLAVGIIYLYRNGYIENFIYRYRSDPGNLPSIRPVSSKNSVITPADKTGPAISGPVKNPLAGDSGYEVTLSVFQKEDELLVRGWVNKGAPCDMLEIRMELSSETGKKVYLWAAVEEVGGSRSRLINKRRWVGRVQGKGFPKWSASVMSVNCISN
jgi:hypothetical protein